MTESNRNEQEDAPSEGLFQGLNALYGHDLVIARRELAWVEGNLDGDPSMPLVAAALRTIIERRESETT